MSIYSDIKSLFGFLTIRRRWQLIGVFSLTLVGALAEVASLGAIVPFLALLADPNVLGQYVLIQDMLTASGIDVSQRVQFAAILFAVLTVFAAVIRILLLRVSSRYIFSVGADFGNEIYRRTIYQPYLYHVSQNSSEVISGINRVTKVVTGVINPLMQASVALVISIAILCILLRIDFVASLAAIISFTVLYSLASFLTRRRLRENSAIISRNDAQRVQAIQEVLGGIRDVIIDGTHAVYIDRFSRVNRKIRQAEAVNLFLAGAPRYLIEAFGMILIVGMACWLSMRPSGIAGAIPLLGALAMGAQRLMPQMQQIFNAWSSINSNRAQLRSTLLILSQPISDEYLRPTLGVKTTQATDKEVPVISVQNIGYRYGEEGPVVLERLSFDIHRGARVGFVGKTGSGKSTLIDLVMGLLSPQEGQILTRGRALTKETRREWQDEIAHVPQSIHLLDTTIAQNIALGVPFDEINWRRLRIAASKAQIDDFIQALPQNYKTCVGERGVRLSGGQRQRIGLARAFYKQATVLILDEATSALDDSTEAQVMKTINALGDEITVLMIAHRLSTLSACDLIVWLEPGGHLRLYKSVSEFLHEQNNCVEIS